VVAPVWQMKRDGSQWTRRWACPRITMPGLTGGAGTAIPRAVIDGVPRELMHVFRASEGTQGA
jgi:hypothetical protein